MKYVCCFIFHFDLWKCYSVWSFLYVYEQSDVIWSWLEALSIYLVERSSVVRQYVFSEYILINPSFMSRRKTMHVTSFLIPKYQFPTCVVAVIYTEYIMLNKRFRVIYTCEISRNMWESQAIIFLRNSKYNVSEPILVPNLLQKGKARIGYWNDRKSIKICVIFTLSHLLIPLSLLCTGVYHAGK